MLSTTPARGARHTWWIHALLLLGAALLFAFFPLADPDLPSHLRIGEMIADRGMVPFTEPYAWTRDGEPYYAYSWLLQLGWFYLLKHVGPFGLHLANAAVGAAAVGAVLLLGRVARWRLSITVTLALANLWVLAGVSPLLRPAQILAILLPLAWAGVFYLRRHPLDFRCALGLLLIAALGANIHFQSIFLGFPFLLWLLMEPSSWKRSVPGGLMILIGLFATPYWAHWHSVLALNLSPNPLLNAGSTPISEFQPGFVLSLHSFPLFAIPASLALLGWAASHVRLRPSERIVWMSVWVLGLALVALRGRYLPLWWYTLLPLAGLSLQHHLEALKGNPDLRSFVRTLLPVCALVLALTTAWSQGVLGPQARALYALEGDTKTRTLPSASARATIPLAEWLLCHTAAGASSRTITEFNRGSYLAWRAPEHSVSIDGRTIFPDSIAAVEARTIRGVAYQLPALWNSADVAFVGHRSAYREKLAEAGWALRVRAYESRDTAEIWTTPQWWATHGSEAATRECHPQAALATPANL